MVQRGSFILAGLVLGTVAIGGFAASTKSLQAELLIASSSAGSASAAYRLLAGVLEWRPPVPSNFHKLSFELTSNVPVSRIEVVSCAGDFENGAELYADLDAVNLYVEGGRRSFVFDLPRGTGDAARPSRVFDINFRHNSQLCIGSLRLFSGDKRVVLGVPRIENSSRPVSTALFDGRPETAATLTEGAVLEFEFPHEMDFRAVRLWNGDQASEKKFRASARATSLSLEAGERRVSLSVADNSGPQLLKLTSPLRTKVLRLSASGAVGNGEIRFSEIQFIGDSGRAFVPDVSGALDAIADSRRSAFRAADLSQIVDRALTLADDGFRWWLRIRSDGSVFVRGRSENLEVAGPFSFVGRYDVIESSKKALRLSVRGFLIASHLELDGNGCPRGCGGTTGPGAFVEDRLSLSATKDGYVFVRDEGPKALNGFEFRSLKMRLSSGEE